MAELYRDHLGNCYPNIPAMAKAYGLNPATVKYRLRTGMPMEQVLAPARSWQRHPRPKDAIAPPEIPAAEKPGDGTKPRPAIAKRTLQYRMASGMTYEEAIAAPNIHGPRECMDHYGIRYPSLKAMCQNYHVDPYEYKKRIAAGKTTEEALQWWRAQDHKENRFKYHRDMCHYWFVTKSHYDRMQAKGIPLEQNLTDWSPNTLRDLGITCIDRPGGYWHISHDGQEYVFGSDGMHNFMCRVRLAQLIAQPYGNLKVSIQEDGRYNIREDGVGQEICSKPWVAWFSVCTW